MSDQPTNTTNTTNATTALHLLIRTAPGLRGAIESPLNRIEVLTSAIDAIDFAAGNQYGSDTSTLVTIINDEIAQLKAALGLRPG
jgi:hypothetical protein